MRIGRLRHKVTIERSEEVRALDGGFSKQWVIKGQAYVSIEGLSAREFSENQQMNGEITHKIRGRGEFDARTDDRIVFRDRYFYVIGPPIDVSERGIVKEVRVKETIPKDQS